MVSVPTNLVADFAVVLGLTIFVGFEFGGPAAGLAMALAGIGLLVVRGIVSNRTTPTASDTGGSRDP